MSAAGLHLRTRGEMVGNGCFCSVAEPKTTRTKSDRLRLKERVSAMFPFLVHSANVVLHMKLKPTFLSFLGAI